VGSRNNGWYYFAAGAALGLDFVLALAAGAGAAFSVALRARLRSRFLALDRLRVFSRAFSFGMLGLRDQYIEIFSVFHVPSYAVAANCAEEA
jgi:hypothetical protein